MTPAARTAADADAAAGYLVRLRQNDVIEIAAPDGRADAPIFRYPTIGARRG